MNVRFALWTPLLLIACSGGGPDGGDNCIPGADPSLEIGLGVGGFSSIEDGEFPLVHGPQGGFHLEIGLLATQLDTSDLVVGHLEGLIEGERYAQSDPWLDFRCDETHGGLVSWGSLLIYEATPEFLDGKLTTVTATVTDVQGTEVSVTQAFTIRDEPVR
jgi:hypothetical protein